MGLFYSKFVDSFPVPAHARSYNMGVFISMLAFVFM